MSATGTHQKAPSATKATRAPSTRTLSANGSRKAPELVLPWRRATHPSRASLPATAIHTSSVDHAAPRSTLRSEEHTSELQSRRDLVCRLLLEKKKDKRRENDSLAQT